MRIVLLGGTGYLGGRLLRRFCMLGNEILCITRTPQKYKNENKIIYCNYERLAENIGSFKPELFVNTACCYQKAGRTDWDIMEANFIIPAKVLQLCMEAGVKRAITMGTSLPDDFNMYSFSKKLFADMGKWYAKSIKVQFINIVSESFYGEGQPVNNFIAMCIEKMLNNEELPLTEGTQKRDFVHVDDVVEAICRLSERHLPGDGEYGDVPVGSGEAPTVREVVEYLYQVTGSHSKLLFGSIPMRKNEPDTLADKTQMEKWGISPRYHWRQGMKQTVLGAMKSDMGDESI